VRGLQSEYVERALGVVDDVGDLGGTRGGRMPAAVAERGRRDDLVVVLEQRPHAVPYPGTHRQAVEEDERLAF
jgi:hypothetical protein